MSQLILDIIREIFWGTTPKNSTYKQFKRDFIIRGISYSLLIVLLLMGVFFLPEVRLLLSSILIVVFIGFVITKHLSIKNRDRKF
ncbi:hypothetical protein EGW35_07205 [Enterococcus durans]|nr:hypothetical protein EGW35_07205 [Enterococcus durans]